MSNMRHIHNEDDEFLPRERPAGSPTQSSLDQSSSLNDEPAIGSSSGSSGSCCGRVRTLYSQLSLAELSGSFGDLGTFVPLFVALGQQRSIHVAPALFLAGLANVLTGCFWDVPMPVQPMKAIAALAIAQGLNRNQVTASGMWMGLLMTLLGATNGIELVNRVVPPSIVAGMQLGVGMSLAIHGIQLVVALTLWSYPDCILTALVAGMITIYCLRPHYHHNDSSASSSQLPPPIGILLLFSAAIIGALNIALHAPTSSSNQDWSWEPFLTWTLSDISPKDWMAGFWEGAIPQLPLTTLNSVISVCALAHTLFPEKRQDTASSVDDAGDSVESLDAVLSRREVAISVGIVNLLSCPFGGLPVCHGAGGLAGQHKLGARHGASIVFLGSLKMILAVTLGTAVLHMLDAFPLSILGVMLVMAGHELALTGFKLALGHGRFSTNRTQPTRESTGASATESDPVQSPSAGSGELILNRMAVALLTAIVILGTKKTHYGVVVGLAAHWIQNAPTWSIGCWRRRQHYVQPNSSDSTDELV